MIKIQLRHLMAYRAVMSAGSITAATHRVNLSQPAISRLIAVMEAELGFKLFYRRGRRLVPTIEGTSFFRRIEGTLAGIDDIPAIADDVRLNKEGRLRVCGIGPLVFGQLLPDAVARYRKINPETQMTLEMRRREDIDEWVASRQADLGFTMQPIESKSVAFQDILTVSPVAVLPKGHRFADKKCIGLDDLRGETLIFPKQSVRLRQIVDTYLLRSPRPLGIDIETSTAIASCHLVAQGVGVAISDPFSASGLDRDLVSIVRWSPNIELTYCAIWPKDREPGDQAQMFLKSVVAASKAFLSDFPQACPAS